MKVINPVGIVENFIKSIESMDMSDIMSFFDDRSTWQNVPHDPAVGISQIKEMFQTIVQRSSQIKWDIKSASFGEEIAWVERIDRFWIDGTEYAVRCNGVFEFDTELGIILSVRDYVDLGEWRSRLVNANL